MSKKEELRTLKGNPEDTPEQKQESDALKAMAENIEGAGTKEVEEIKKSFLETLNVGDIIVSKTGARREVKEITSDEKDPRKRLFRFERTGKKGVTEEILDSDHLDSKANAIDYTLTPDQQKRVSNELKALQREYVEKGWGWDKNIHPKAFRRQAEKKIYDEDIKKRRSEEPGGK